MFVFQPTYLEMANFELFSSGPHEVRISMSERYPTADWATLGHVLAADTREMQAFRFASTGSYAKFIRVSNGTHKNEKIKSPLFSARVALAPRPRALLHAELSPHQRRLDRRRV